MSDELVPVSTPTPMSLAHYAIEKGVVADLEKMMLMQERFEARRAQEAYSLALADCQADMPCVVKDAENLHTKKRYARLENVITLIKPVLTQHGFSLSFGEEDSPQPGMMRIVCDVFHRGGHKERYRLDVPMDGKGSSGGSSSMNAPQAKGSTTTYGRRYLTYMIFNLAIADEDLDGNAPDDSATINDDQLKTLKGLVMECEKYGAITVKSRFLKWLQVDTLEDIPQSRFIEARDNLVKSRDKAKRETEGL